MLYPRYCSYTFFLPYPYKRQSEQLCLVSACFEFAHEKNLQILYPFCMQKKKLLAFYGIRIRSSQPYHIEKVWLLTCIPLHAFFHSVCILFTHWDDPFDLFYFIHSLHECYAGTHILFLLLVCGRAYPCFTYYEYTQAQHTKIRDLLCFFAHFSFSFQVHSRCSSCKTNQTVFLLFSLSHS